MLHHRHSPDHSLTLPVSEYNSNISAENASINVASAATAGVSFSTSSTSASASVSPGASPASLPTCSQHEAEEAVVMANPTNVSPHMLQHVMTPTTDLVCHSFPSSMTAHSDNTFVTAASASTLNTLSANCLSLPFRVSFPGSLRLPAHRLFLGSHIGTGASAMATSTSGHNVASALSAITTSPSPCKEEILTLDSLSMEPLDSLEHQLCEYFS
ncbi:unnamed protein product [Protopolystoma xenopodis]|uniref:Uncharacterized protein n=1 Tax=Protopolystoma xenopodis TaxID=117903 RepID=A0A3S4ZFA1_9PLAT|nr:unnamed protein product [Protopolystoma xenopodis]